MNIKGTLLSPIFGNRSVSHKTMLFGIYPPELPIEFLEISFNVGFSCGKISYILYTILVISVLNLSVLQIYSSVYSI